jgi:hypothetical protein
MVQLEADWGPTNLYRFHPRTAEDPHSTPSQSRELMKYAVGGFLLLSTFPAFSVTWASHNM